MKTMNKETELTQQLDRYCIDATLVSIHVWVHKLSKQNISCK